MELDFNELGLSRLDVIDGLDAPVGDGVTGSQGGTSSDAPQRTQTMMNRLASLANFGGQRGSLNIV